jgi:hypothetical protein
MDAAEIRLTAPSFTPGGEIRGEVSWSRAAAPRRVELRLFWQTQGRGDRDSETVWEQVFDGPAAEELREFALAAPATPGSFSGKLISLSWEFELVIDGKSSARRGIVIAPGGVELDFQKEEWLALDTPWDAPKFSWLEKLRPKPSR